MDIAKQLRVVLARTGCCRPRRGAHGTESARRRERGDHGVLEAAGRLQDDKAGACGRRSWTRA